MAYVKRFPRPVMVAEEIRDNFEKSKELNRRFHSLLFRKLQEIIKYKALLRGIEVNICPRKKSRTLQKPVIDAGMLLRQMEGSSDARNAGLSTTGFKRMHKYSHALTRGMGQGSLAFGPVDKGGAKLSLTPEAPPLKAEVVHI